MLTQYPIHITWSPTPEQLADQEAQKVLDTQNRERQAVYLADPSFMSACAALEVREGLPPQSLSMFAGHRVGPVDSYADMFVTNPEQCLEVYRHFHPKPHDPKHEQTQVALARSLARDAKRDADAAYKIEYQTYLDACRDRKARIAFAKQECESIVSAARARLRDAETEPLPEMPVKRQ